MLEMSSRMPSSVYVRDVQQDAISDSNKHFAFANVSLTHNSNYMYIIATININVRLHQKICIKYVCFLKVKMIIFILCGVYSCY